MPCGSAYAVVLSPLIRRACPCTFTNACARGRDLVRRRPLDPRTTFLLRRPRAELTPEVARVVEACSVSAFERESEPTRRVGLHSRMPPSRTVDSAPRNDTRSPRSSSFGRLHLDSEAAHGGPRTRSRRSHSTRPPTARRSALELALELAGTDRPSSFKRRVRRRPVAMSQAGRSTTPPSTSRRSDRSLWSAR
jgi:hypothetical protein